MTKKSVMAMPIGCFFAVAGVSILGIILGSFFDYPISVALVNKTEAGKLFADFGQYFSYCLFPAAGSCMYLGFKKKGAKYLSLAKLLLFLSWFYSVFSFNKYFGSKVRALFGYVAGESPALVHIGCWLLIALVFVWIPFVCVKIFDDADPDKLIAVGVSILVGCIFNDFVNQWLKPVASRPRPKYLFTLDAPLSEFRRWWEMIPELADGNDNLQSWPSGHATLASVMFALPMLADVLRKRSLKKNAVAFAIACVFVLLVWYNRIHMANHFLSDVGFGTLIAYLPYAGISTVFLKAAEHKAENT